MTTANMTYFKPLTWTRMEKVPIDVIPLHSRGWCCNCLRTGALEMLDTPFLSRPLVRCSQCFEVLQHKSRGVRQEVEFILLQKKLRQEREAAAVLLEAVEVEG